MGFHGISWDFRNPRFQIRTVLRTLHWSRVAPWQPTTFTSGTCWMPHWWNQQQQLLNQILLAVKTLQRCQAQASNLINPFFLHVYVYYIELHKLHIFYSNRSGCSRGIFPCSVGMKGGHKACLDVWQLFAFSLLADLPGWSTGSHQIHVYLLVLEAWLMESNIWCRSSSWKSEVLRRQTQYLGSTTQLVCEHGDIAKNAKRGEAHAFCIYVPSQAIKKQLSRMHGEDNFLTWIAHVPDSPDSGHAGAGAIRAVA